MGRREGLALTASVAAAVAGSSVATPEANAFLGLGGAPKVEEWEKVRYLHENARGDKRPTRKLALEEPVEVR